MAAPMSLFMMLSLLSSKFPQAWPCKLPFLNNSPISCFNQGCGKFSFSGKQDFNSFSFCLDLCLWQCLTYRHGGGRGHPHQPVTAAAILSKVFLSPWHLLSVLSKAMRGRSARAGPDLVGCWSTSWTSATHQQCLPTFSSHSSTCWSGQLSWNQRHSWTTLKFSHRWAPTSQLLNRLEVSFSISLDEEKQWFVT